MDYRSWSVPDITSLNPWIKILKNRKTVKGPLSDSYLTCAASRCRFVHAMSANTELNENTILVLLGASGDLAKKKLVRYRTWIICVLTYR